MVKSIDIMILSLNLKRMNQHYGPSDCSMNHTGLYVIRNADRLSMKRREDR